MSKEKYNTGESIVLKGTGSYWGGCNYTGTIVDIRESDETIKVRYSDGGYKRFSKKEFEEHVLPTDSSPFKFEAYELDHTYYDPTALSVEEVGNFLC
jgi:hypothetical protein